MNIVKWINNFHIELFVDDKKLIGNIKKENIKVYKHPKVGKRISSNYFYIRLELDKPYSTASYTFSRNKCLEEICFLLNKLDFIFWDTFKTEISPYDYMSFLQNEKILKKEFLYIEAGENIVKIRDFKEGT